MPLYEYECEACGHRFERIQKFSDPHADVCPKCGERKLHKLVSSPAIQFKGSGWYVNDYAKKTTPPAGDPSTAVAPAAKGDDKSSSEKGSSDKGSSDKSPSEKSSSDKGSSEKGSSEKSASAPTASAKD